VKEQIVKVLSVVLKLRGRRQQLCKIPMMDPTSCDGQTKLVETQTRFEKHLILFMHVYIIQFSTADQNVLFLLVSERVQISAAAMTAPSPPQNTRKD